MNLTRQILFPLTSVTLHPFSVGTTSIRTSHEPYTHLISSPYCCLCGSINPGEFYVTHDHPYLTVPRPVVLDALRRQGDQVHIWDITHNNERIYIAKRTSNFCAVPQCLLCWTVPECPGSGCPVQPANYPILGSSPGLDTIGCILICGYLCDRRIVLGHVSDTEHSRQVQALESSHVVLRGLVRSKFHKLPVAIRH